MKLKTKIIISVLVLVNAVCIPSAVYSNTHINTEEIVYKNEKIPDKFDGVKIAHLSDYHNHGGKYENKLINTVSAQNPDYIFITGDTADKLFTDTDKANTFLRDLSDIAECYMVWGNHDTYISEEERQKMRDCAEECGIHLLENRTETVQRDDQYISVTGYTSLAAGYNSENPPENEFNIILYHFPEEFTKIADVMSEDNNPPELIFTGHAHGGLIGIPFIGGLVAPGQGFFPKYTSGRYDYKESSMIVSRGVGNSTLTRRLNDPFHLIICTLEK